MCLADTGHMQHPYCREEEEKFKLLSHRSLFLFQAQNLQQTRRWSTVGTVLSCSHLWLLQGWDWGREKTHGQETFPLAGAVVTYCYCSLGVTTGTSAYWEDWAGVPSQVLLCLTKFFFFLPGHLAFHPFCWGPISHLGILGRNPK